MDEKALKQAWQEAERALQENQKTDLNYGIREGAPPIAPWPKEPCKLIFLDFDGVLNLRSQHRSPGNSLSVLAAQHQRAERAARRLGSANCYFKHLA